MWYRRHNVEIFQHVTYNYVITTVTKKLHIVLVTIEDLSKWKWRITKHMRLAAIYIHRPAVFLIERLIPKLIFQSEKIGDHLQFAARSLHLKGHENRIMVYFSFAESLKDGTAKYFYCHHLVNQTSRSIPASLLVHLKYSSCFLFLHQKAYTWYSTPYSKRETAYILLG